MSSALDRNADALLQQKALQTSHYERLESELQLASRNCRLNVSQTKEALGDVKRAQQDLTEAQEESRQLEQNLLQQQRLRLAMLSAITKELLQKTADSSKHIEDVQLPWTGIPSRIAKLASEANEAIIYNKSRNDVSNCLSSQSAVLSCALESGAWSIVEYEAQSLAHSLPSILNPWLASASSSILCEQHEVTQARQRLEDASAVVRDSTRVLTQQAGEVQMKSEESCRQLDMLNRALQCAEADDGQKQSELLAVANEREDLVMAVARGECFTALLSEKVESTLSLVQDRTFHDMCNATREAFRLATSRIAEAIKSQVQRKDALSEVQRLSHLRVALSVDSITTSLWVQRRQSALSTKLTRQREYCARQGSILQLIRQEAADRSSLLNDFALDVSAAHNSYFRVAFQLLIASAEAAAKCIECDEDRHRMGLLDDEMQAVQRTIEDAARRTAQHEEKERRRLAVERNALFKAVVNAPKVAPPHRDDQSTGEPEPRKTVATVIRTGSQVQPLKRMTIADLRQRALVRSPSTESGVSTDFFVPQNNFVTPTSNDVRLAAEAPLLDTMMTMLPSGNGGAAARVAMETPSPMPRAPQRATGNHGILPTVARSTAVKAEMRQPAHLKLNAPSSKGLAAIFGSQSKSTAGQAKGSQSQKLTPAGHTMHANRRPQPRRNLNDVADDDDEFNIFANP